MGLLDNLSALPVKMYDSAEGFLKTLLGPAITETGEMIASEVRHLYLKRQIAILQKSEQLLKAKGLNAKAINLKTLTPLLDKIGLEENQEIQDLWANLIANVSQDNSDEAININCINILGQLTSNEAQILEFFYEKYLSYSDKFLKSNLHNKVYDSMKFMPGSYYEFKMQEVHNHVLTIGNKLDLYQDRLIAFGLFKTVDPDLKENDGETKRSKEYSLEYSDNIHFTSFGLYFIGICTTPPK